MKLNGRGFLQAIHGTQGKGKRLEIRHRDAARRASPPSPSSGRTTGGLCCCGSELLRATTTTTYLSLNSVNSGHFLWCALIIQSNMCRSLRQAPGASRRAKESRDHSIFYFVLYYSVFRIYLMSFRYRLHCSLRQYKHRCKTRRRSQVSREVLVLLLRLVVRQVRRYIAGST